MKVYTYETELSFNLIFDFGGGVTAVEEWFRKKDYPGGSAYISYVYKDLEDYESFNYNSNKEYMKTYIGEI